jgi:hypothetical protein
VPFRRIPEQANFTGKEGNSQADSGTTGTFYLYWIQYITDHEDETLWGVQKPGKEEEKANFEGQEILGKVRPPRLFPCQMRIGITT